MEFDIAKYEAMPYRRFTQRWELDKALNSLKGILEGIVADQQVSETEVQELKHWCDLHRSFSRRHPFNEVLPLIDAALADGILSGEEMEDIFWLVQKMRPSSKGFDLVRVSIQALHGLLHGLLADNDLSDEEIRGLQDWVERHDFLKGVYPYDEIDSLITAILADGKITQRERDMARAFFGEFVDTKTSLNVNRSELDELQAKYSIKGICATCPEVVVPSSVFCLTGVSVRAKRKDIKDLLETLGGVFTDRVTQDTQYLVVGAGGNPCWVFSCYGRKVEAAVDLRRAGHRITILHENDLWDELIPYSERKGIDHNLYLAR